jgi:hypothetical protein
MTNARILLMRHAEKTGDPMEPHLSQDGYARAAKLADFIPGGVKSAPARIGRKLK